MKAMKMQGFAPEFENFPDYIIGITYKIWEGRDLGDALRRHYAPKVIVRMPGGVSTGNQGAIAATMAVLAAFPDRTLLGEDVIWHGEPDTGMLSSHRIVSTATHLGAGLFGPPTNKRLTYRILADCHARNNAIDDEWLIRDQGAIVRQIGQDPQAFARAQIMHEGGPEACVRPCTPAIDIAGPYRGRGNDNEWGQRHADILTRIMNGDMKTIKAEYDRAVQTEYPGGQTGHAPASADRFWMGLRAAFPSARFEIHHQIGREDAHMPLRSAVRWSLSGAHDGWGAFGPPSGADVHVMGISHAEFGAVIPGRVRLRREWTLYDETAIWKQILLHRGDL